MIWFDFGLVWLFEIGSHYVAHPPASGPLSTGITGIHPYAWLQVIMKKNFKIIIFMAAQVTKQVFSNVLHY
jgi:hypothetical protein